MTHRISLTKTSAITLDRGKPAAVPEGPKTILIVEDDPLARMSEAEFLRLEGYHVLTAADVASALDMAEMERPNAMLLDLKLAGSGSGVDLLRELRARGDTTPVAIVTGHYGLDDDTEAEIRRLDASLAYKPLWVENVLALVQDLLSQIIWPVSDASVDLQVSAPNPATT